MANPPHPENDDIGRGISVTSDRPSTTGTPSWVKVFGIICLILVLLFFILQIVGGGKHGPSRHLRSSKLGDTSLISITGIHVTPEVGY